MVKGWNLIVKDQQVRTVVTCSLTRVSLDVVTGLDHTVVCNNVNYAVKAG